MEELAFQGPREEGEAGPGCVQYLRCRPCPATLCKEQKGSRVSSETSYPCPIHCGNGFLNEPTAATGLIMKLPAKLNDPPRAPGESHTSELVLSGAKFYIYQ